MTIKMTMTIATVIITIIIIIIIIITDYDYDYYHYYYYRNFCYYYLVVPNVRSKVATTSFRKKLNLARIAQSGNL